MLILVPLVCVMLGLAFGGGLFYASRRVQSKLQTIEEARPCQAGRPIDGLVKIHGKVQAVNPDQLLTSPIEQIPCVYFRLVIEQFQQNHFSSSSGPRRNNIGGSWVPVIEDVQAIPMHIADETGTISIDAQSAQLDFQQSRMHANVLSSLPAELEESLKQRYKVVTKTWFIPKQMRYTEIVIKHDTEVFAVGECEVTNGRGNLVKKDHPLMMTFRNEEQVLRNGRITVTIFKVLACVFPLLFVLMAWGMYSHLRDVSGGGSTRQEAAKPAATNQVNDTVNRLKTSGSLNDRARAARQLADMPVAKDRIPEIATQLNTLLDSSDNFHRDAALAAINKGWGSSANVATLRRLQQNAPNARSKKDLTAALDRIGS